MPDIRKSIDSLLKIADLVVPLVGGPLGAAALQMAKAVAAGIDSLQDTASETDQVKLQSKRDALEAKVMAHANQTIDSLD